MEDFLLILLIVLAAVLWVWALVDISKKRDRKSLLWLFLVLMFPVLGSLFYFQMKNRGRRASGETFYVKSSTLKSQTNDHT